MKLTRNISQNLKEHGFCEIPDVLDAPLLRKVKHELTLAARDNKKRSIPTHVPGLDPNKNNVRIFNLLSFDPIFMELITHPVALGLVRHLLSEDFIISNFTANIAHPGSLSMAAHSDLSVVIPPPWTQPWSINIMWFLDSARTENGATLYLPNSHLIQDPTKLPEKIIEKMQPIEAKAGSVVAMDGRLWHTSGENHTTSEERALLFGYYTRSFIRPQWNFNVALSEEQKSHLSPELKKWLGLDLSANIATFTPTGDPHKGQP